MKYTNDFAEILLKKYGCMDLNNKDSMKHLITNEINNKLQKVSLYMLHIYKNNNLLKGSTSEERYMHFLEITKSERYEHDILFLFPELKELLQNLIFDFKSFLESVNLIEKDNRNIILKTFNAKGNMIKINRTLGDSHSSSKRVLEMQYEEGQLIYKPHPLKNDVEWNKLLDWMRIKNENLDLRGVNTLNLGDCGFQEKIEAKPCENLNDIYKLYFRIGIISCLAYLFRISDLHMENLIISRNMPYIVDLETIFQPDNIQINSRDYKDASNTIISEIRNSILSTQLFPGVVSNTAVDISGVTGHGGQIIKNAGRKIINRYTDKMHLIKIDRYIEEQLNRGIFNGTFLETRDYKDNIIQGFQETYNTILDNKAELINMLRKGDLFQNIRPRILFRDTEIYARLLDLSMNPKYLKSKDSRLSLFYKLRDNNKSQRHNKVIDSEIYDLLKGDIPYFYGRENSKLIYNSQGNLCFELEKSPIDDYIIEKVESLSKDDLKKQCWFINTSMAIQKKTLNRAGRGISISNNINNEVKDYDSIFLKEAESIGKILIRNAVIDEKSYTINWMDVKNIYPNWQFCPQDLGLYSGLPGNSIFFASLFKITKKIKYKDILSMILNTIEIEYGKGELESLSAFSGLGSLAYMYGFLGRQFKETKYHEKAKQYILKCKDLIEATKDYDIVEGVAGCLIVAVELYKLLKDNEIYDFANLCGEYLLKTIVSTNNIYGWLSDEKEQHVLAGMSHGNAGISLALGKLYSITKEHRYYEVVISAIDYENSLFSKDKNNWIDLRLSSSDVNKEGFYPVNWCHGAPGIGMSRLTLYGINKDDILIKDISAAIEITKIKVSSESDCLCHGTMGNLDIFLLAHGILGDDKYLNWARSICSSTITVNKDKGWRCGTGQDIQVPGMMTGLSGIGYQLLRTSDTSLPSVLTLDL